MFVPRLHTKSLGFFLQNLLSVFIILTSGSSIRYIFRIQTTLLSNMSNLNSIKRIWKSEGLVCPICNKEGSNCSYFDNSKSNSPNRYSCLSEIPNHKDFKLLKFKSGFYIYSDKGDIRTFSSSSLSNYNQYANQPSEAEVHEQYVKLIEHLSLSGTHTSELAKRGISLDLALGLGFRTLPGNYKIDFENKLSGFSNNISTNRKDVLLIPIHYFDTIRGYQIKTGNTQNKYIWGAGDFSAHNREGKLPVAVYNVPESGVIDELWVTEGYLKAAVTAFKFDKPVFGAGGGTINRSQELKSLILESEAKRVVIFPDAGSAKNKSIFAVNLKHYREIKNLGVEVFFGDYGQFQDKSVGDIDDQLVDVDIKLVDSEAYMPHNSIVEAIESLGYLSEAKKYDTYEGEYLPGKKYLVNDLTSTYEALASQKVKIVHDCSPTGAGKSHAVSNITVSNMFAENGKLVYGISSPRNPSIDKIRDEFKLLQGRHNGLYKTEAGRVVTTVTDEKVSESNCKYNSLFILARERGTPTTSICQKCPFNKSCKKSEGDGFGYKHNYRKAIVADKIVTNPTSIPTDYVDENTAVIIDEFTSVKSIATKKFETNILTNKAVLRQSYEVSQFFAKLANLKSKEDINVSGYFYDELNKEGSTFLDSIKKLAEAEDATLQTNEEAIERLFTQNWIAGKKQVKYDLMADADNTIEHAYFNNLQESIQDAHFSVTKKGEFLEISSINNSIKNNIRKAGTIIIQDATTSTQEIADFFGINLEDIVVIELATNKATTRNIHITGIGNITTKRNSSQIGTIDSLREVMPSFLNLEAGAIGFIDYNRYAKGTDLTYFSTARGSNDFVEKKALVLIGTPLTNLGAVLSRFEVLKGRASHFKDPEFLEFYAHKTNEEAIQAIGRLRASRRLDESLTVVVLGDSDLPCLDDMERVSVAEVDATISTRKSNVDKRVQIAAQMVVDNNNEAITQRELANAFGITVRALSAWVKRNFESWDAFMTSLCSQFDNYVGDDVEKIVEKIQSMSYFELKEFISQIAHVLTRRQLEILYTRLEVLKEILIH